MGIKEMLLVNFYSHWYSLVAHVPSINSLCGSEIRAVVIGAQSILLEDSDDVVVGGTKSMKCAPYISPNHRFGERMGNGSIQLTQKVSKNLV